MNDRTRQGLDTLRAALILGVLGDVLLRATPWGLNVLLWMLVFVAAGVGLLVRWRRGPLTREGRWLVLPLLFFAACFVWRDSLTLRLLDALALLLALGLVTLHTQTARVWLASFRDHAEAAAFSAFNYAFGFPTLVLSDVQWREIPRGRWTRHAGAVVRGLVIAVPLILLFGALLMAADAVFEGLITNATNLNAGNLLGHFGLTLLFVWVAGGALRGLLDGRDRVVANSNDPSLLSLDLAGSEAGKERPGDAANEKDEAGVNEKPDEAVAVKRLSLGIVEIGMVLGLLDLLFLAFVTVQVRYFFGGASLVQTTTGLTYAEYARRGFFELVWVAALVLPLLLVAHWLLRKENRVHERIFRVLAGAQVGLLFIIMASAVGRMRLYQQEYGLTEQRLYTSVFMLWLAVVFVWFAWTVLRGERERFASGAIVAGFVMLGLLHVFNPDAVIVRVNVAHAQGEGRSFDGAYAVTLSADAAPTLAQSLPLLSSAVRCSMARNLSARWSPEESADWRTWNWSRSRAQAAVRDEAMDALMQECTRESTEPSIPLQMIGPAALPPTAVEPPIRRIKE